MRLQEARDRSFRYVDSKASVMSRPLLGRAGFQLPSEVTDYRWHSGGRIAATGVVGGPVSLAESRQQVIWSPDAISRTGFERLGPRRSIR